MKLSVKRSALASGALTALCMAMLFSGSVTAAETGLSPELANRIKHGEYLSRVGDCAACHTNQGGKTFAGGLPMSTPIGAIYSSNITPDPKTGIGNYSFDDFNKAVRFGVSKKLGRLYPAMPYTSFVKVSESDMQDLYLYFMYGVKPIAEPDKESDIPWPLSIRWPLAVWDGIFRHDGIYQADASQSDEWNRGAYLVQGLGHCGACHSPRGIGFQEKGLDSSDEAYLTGGTLEGWHAPALTADKRLGLGSWSQKEIAQFLKTGHTEKTAAFGSMVDVIQDSTQYMSDSDLMAIAAYLGTVGAEANKYSKPAESDQGATRKALYYGDMSQPGAQLYVDNCAACHRTDGKGYTNTFPALAQNPVLLSEDPSSLISLVLHGSKVPMTQSAPTGLTMPDFGWRLNDQEVADLVTFIRNGWGNKAPAVSKDDVADLRE